MTSGEKTIIELNKLLAKFPVSFVIILISMPLLAASYFNYKNHKFGFIISTIYLILSTYYSYIGIKYPADIVLISLYFFSSISGYDLWRNTPQKDRDNPKDFEKVINIILKASGCFAFFILSIIITYLLIRGAKYVTYEFITTKWRSMRIAAEVIKGFTEGPIGGIRDQIYGTLTTIIITTIFITPFALSSAIYLSEYATKNIITSILNLFIQTLAGIPSVILGLVGFSFFTLRLRYGQCLLAGSITLGFMILPWITNVCMEAIKAVPNEYREASYALGATKWQTTKFIVFGPAMSGVITGLLMGVGKIVGETTILIFTLGMGSDIFPSTIQLTGHRIPSLTVWISQAFREIHTIQDMTSMYDGQNLAFSGAIILMLIFLVITSSALLIKNYFHKKSWGNTR
jgi:phosphate transport system permease protein